MKVSVNITQRFEQIALATILGASCCSLGAVSANAFSFQDTNQAKLEFFDESGALVGNGGFTYQPFSGRFVIVNGFPVYENPDNPFPPFQPGSPIILSGYTPPASYSQVTSFRANLFTIGFTFPANPIGITFDLKQTGQGFSGSSVYLWEPPNTETFLGGPANTLISISGSDGRNPVSGIFPRNNWEGCLPSCGFLAQQFYSINSDGTWSFFGSPASGIGPVRIGGTWKATAIPEPTTIAGSIAAAIVIWRLKQRRGSKRAA